MMGEHPFRFRAAAVPKDVDTALGDAVRFTLIIDHGFRIYSEQALLLAGAVTVPGKRELVISFVENWIAQAAKPSTLWVNVHEFDPLKRSVVSLERVALDEIGQLTETLESLSTELIKQGLAE